MAIKDAPGQEGAPPDVADMIPMFFSTAFGMCVDRFGTPWMVVGPDPNPAS